MTEPALTRDEIAAVEDCRSGLEQVNLVMRLRGIPYAEAYKLLEEWAAAGRDASPNR